MATKTYDKLTFKERLVHHLHNDLAFDCQVSLKENEFHTCKYCERRANIILSFFEFEITRVRQQKV